MNLKTQEAIAWYIFHEAQLDLYSSQAGSLFIMKNGIYTRFFSDHVVHGLDPARFQWANNKVSKKGNVSSHNDKNEF